MKRLVMILAIILLGVTILYSNEAYDTGFVTWQQPNGVEFTARQWSDGFFWWMETQDGYRIIKLENQQ